MYDFIYYIVYKQQIEKGKSLGFSRYNGCLIVGLTLIIHLLLIFSILKTIFLNWFTNHIGKVNQGILFLFVLLVFGSVFYYYNARVTEKILKRYSQDVEPMKMLTYFKIIIIIFVPLIIGIIFSSRY
jgi:glucan phosphoethanolaminetransferase (alkaline phosphatase superfamily)